jgi:hypothetical protein
MKRRYTHHGMTGTKIHEVWKEMKRRCKGNYAKTKSYLERGIKPCREWEDAKPFIDWALSHGYREGLQLDRIDNDQGYSPDNCRFVTPKENANNRSTTIYITHNGERRCLMDWSEIAGIDASTIRSRITRGWDVEKALTQKPKIYKHRTQ